MLQLNCYTVCDYYLCLKKFILIVESNPPDTASTSDALSVNSSDQPPPELADSAATATAAGTEGSGTQAGDLMDLDTQTDVQKSDDMDTS